MSGLLPICPVHAVRENAPIKVEVEGLPPLAVFLAGSSYFVTADKCTHGGGSLSEGAQDGTQVECPLHGGVFDLSTGQPMRFPCRVPLRTWATERIDDWLCIATS